jgi:hypothetical protein
MLSQLETYQYDEETGLPHSRTIWFFSLQVPDSLPEPSAVVYQHWEGRRLQRETSANFATTYSWAQGLLSSSETQSADSLVQTLFVYNGPTELTGRWTLSRTQEDQPPLDIKEQLIWLDEVSLEITMVQQNNPEQFGQSFWRWDDKGQVLSLETRYGERRSRKDFYTQAFDPEAFFQRYRVPEESGEGVQEP